MAPLYEWGCCMKGSSIMIPPAIRHLRQPKLRWTAVVPVKLVDFSILKDWKFQRAVDRTIPV